MDASAPCAIRRHRAGLSKLVGYIRAAGLLQLLLLACRPAIAAARPVTNLLLIINKKSIDSQAVGNYYAAKRNISKSNILTISCEPSDRILEPDYDKKIRLPIATFLRAHKGKIDYIVLTKGIPYLIAGPWQAVDSELCFPLYFPGTKPMPNPYFEAKTHFTSAKYGMFLVTRLDAWKLADAKALVDRSLAARPARGTFLYDGGGNYNSPAFEDLDRQLLRAAKKMSAKGFKVIEDHTTHFVGNATGLMGYMGWGSNDSHFNRNGYRGLRYLPGALAETFVSTSLRSFDPNSKGQSLITDLIAGGVTGVKGYVSEPFSSALAHPEILFDRYTSGFNLAESFYAASRFINWKDVVIGDPLCSPY